MSKESLEHDSTFDEIDRLINDEEFCRTLEEWYKDTGREVTPTSPASITPDSLNTAFLEETSVTEHTQQEPLSPSNTELSAILRELMEQSLEQERPPIDKPLLMVTTTSTTALTVAEETAVVTVTEDLGETMDLSSPNSRTIDLCTPKPDTIDLCTPETESNLNPNIESPVRLSPK